MPHFQADPQVGLVGAFTLPKEPYTTWIDRLRMFELIVSFGFVRPTTDLVDGVFCIPGTFTAFRRVAALEVGGFTEGIYGEDVDFTYAVARIGYRAVIDTRVRSYEDVPNTQRQLRTQRTRWNRGGTMAFARFVPVATGLSGPRFWFFGTRQAVRRFLAPLHLTVFTYVLAAAVLSADSAPQSTPPAVRHCFPGRTLATGDHRVHDLLPEVAGAVVATIPVPLCRFASLLLPRVLPQLQCPPGDHQTHRGRPPAGAAPGADGRRIRSLLITW